MKMIFPSHIRKHSVTNIAKPLA